MWISKKLSRQRRAWRGFTMLEVVFALFIFMMMIMIFAAVFPMAVQAAKQGNNYAQALALCQHKIDEIEGLGYTGAIYTSTNGSKSMSGLGYVDSKTSGTNTFYSAPFTNADNLTSYFPAGSTGTVQIVADPNVCASGATSCSVEDVTVTVTWVKAGTRPGWCRLTTNLIQMPDD